MPKAVELARAIEEEEVLVEGNCAVGKVSVVLAKLRIYEDRASIRSLRRSPVVVGTIARCKRSSRIGVMFG